MEKNKIELKLYLIIIFFFAISSSIIVSLCYQELFFKVFGAMMLGILLVIIIDGLTATICRILPIKCANFESKAFIVSKKEKKFYESLCIKKWKDKIPEIGHFTGFRKNKVDKPNDIEYIKRFLHEICYGQIGHNISVLTGFLLLLIPWFKPFWLPLSLVIAIVNGWLNILPTMVLRYNSYTLLFMYKRLKQKQVS